MSRPFLATIAFAAFGLVVASSGSGANADVPDAAPAPTCGPGETRYGSTCCLPAHAREEDKYPGMVYLDCHGPQIGRVCRKETDCDVACSCDPDPLLSPRDGPLGPRDGTRGAVGHCAGRLQLGVFQCRIDEHGVVGHLIVE
ncbi:MAG TPA: hypothetical protein VGH28_00315 [Polyangiaceae bacterium]|jgi:hypothetical protein